MLRYLVRRVLYAVPILLGVSLLTFILFYMAASPRQIARTNMSTRNPTEQQIQDWLREHGYDKPRIEQFKEHVTGLMLFRFGKSDTSDEDIWVRIKRGVGPSFTVAALVFLAGLLVDVTLALFFAYFRGTYVDYSGTFLCVLLMSISYLVYLIVGQFLLARILKYFPTAGFTYGIEGLKFLMMPMFIGVVSYLGAQVRLYRTFVLEEANQDYVRTARAKGVDEKQVLFGHVLKNAAIPILTTVVAQIPLLLLGGLLMESFFGIPGLGGMTVDAIRSQDFAMVRAMVFLGSVLYIIGYTLTDISYALVDPRVRLE